MTATVQINVAGANIDALNVSDDALAKVSFNPNDRPAVAQTRILTAALISIAMAATPAQPQPLPDPNQPQPGQPQDGTQRPQIDFVIHGYLAAMNRAISMLA